MKYNIVFKLVLMFGVVFYLNAEGKNIDPCFDCDDKPILLSENNLGEHPQIHDVSDMPGLENRPPDEGEIKRGIRGKKRHEKKITPELEIRINDALKEHFPEFYSKAADLKQNNPVIYKRLLRKLRRHIRKSREPKEEKIDLISMIFDESEVDVLVSKYKNSNNVNEKSKLKLVIKEKISQGFDRRENIEQKVIERIEKNIAKKKQNHSERVKNKEKLINENLEKLLK